MLEKTMQALPRYAKLILPPQCSFVHNSSFMLAAEWGVIWQLEIF
jgi:hypothetical protein